MYGITSDLRERFDDIQTVYRHLELMQNGNVRYEEDFTEQIDVITCTKAGIVLMLYNAVESIITKCIARIHQALIDDCLCFDDCNDAIQKLIIVYYENAKSKSSNIHDQVPYIIALHNYLKGHSTFSLSHDELSKYYTLYSGNLDAKEVRGVLKQYGIATDDNGELQVSELQSIKKYRNQLAHGEKSFHEIGVAITIQQVDQMIQKTQAFLNAVINTVSRYITNQQYKRA